MSEAKKGVLQDVVPYFAVATSPGSVDLRQRFAGLRTVVDFGAGMGAHTMELATAGFGVLAIDVHSPGVCAIAVHAHERQLENVAVHLGDGVALLAEALVPGTVDEVHVLFPDPWPKARHHKRRLVTEGFLEIVCRVLDPDGRLVIVSDDAGYTAHITEVVAATSVMQHDERPFDYEPTGYHNRALRLGNTITVFGLRPSRPA